MSMQKLSTELDCAIVSFLEDDKKALSALLKVSKYYRTLVEPHLYQALAFMSDEWESLTRLFLTLIKREELAAHITKFTLDCGTDTPLESLPPTMDNLVQNLWDSVSAIRDKLNDALSPKESRDGTSLAFQILSQLYTTELPDAVVSLVLCMATNLRELNLCAQDELPLRSVWGVLGFGWDHSTKRPLGKLKSLSICGQGGVTLPRPVILPSMSYLGITGGEFGVGLEVGLYPFYHPAPIPEAPNRPALKDLWLNGVGVTPASIQHIISSPWLHSLQGLHVQRNFPYDDDMRASWNLPEMLRALEQYAPSLNTLEWSYQDYSEEPPVFDTFRNLVNLVYLHVDLHLMCPVTDDECEALRSPSDLFPPSLIQLRISDIPCKKLGRIVGRLIEQLPSGSAVMDVIKAIGSKVPFKTLILDVNMFEYDDDDTSQFDLPKTLDFLRLAADVWTTMGMQLKVYCIPDTNEEDSHEQLI